MYEAGGTQVQLRENQLSRPSGFRCYNWQLKPIHDSGSNRTLALYCMENPNDSLLRLTTQCIALILYILLYRIDPSSVVHSEMANDYFSHYQLGFAAPARRARSLHWLYCSALLRAQRNMKCPRKIQSSGTAYKDSSIQTRYSSDQI